MNKEKDIRVRMTEKEKKVWVAVYKRAGFKTLSDMIRKITWDYIRKHWLKKKT